MAKNESCPLKWEWNNDTWTAESQVMDPEMTDEPVDTWCREWCLAWCIYVDEDGDFWIDDSDALLFKEAHAIHSERHRTLEELKAKIELLEQYIREMDHPLSDGSKVVLLQKEVYCR
jgi:hypothetical protein